MSAEQLAELSDLAVLAAVLLYVLAMIAFATELAFGRYVAGKKAGRVTARPARQVVTVGASGGAGDGVAEETAEPADGPVAEEAAPPSRLAVRAGTAGLALAWLGWAANLAAIVTRGFAVSRWPWGNMYEFVVALCFAAVTAFLLTQLRHNVRFLGAFVMVTAALGLGLAVKVFYTAAGPVVPALNSYWIAIHVSAAIIASGLFAMAGVAGVLYLVRGDGMSRLPSREDLERVAHRAIVFAFPLWTFAVIAGALWADRAWGRYWGWDPKEVWSFITWVAYAAYLHAKVTAGWKGKAATVVQLVAFACLLFNLIGVNIFVGGMHSYADV
ncbi:Cytochrome c biogenesis protein CcsA [Nonomuraea coxensis DSM 45129]|uniref:Cytochrome c biogenesis protein CcsA n=1 Tax=Nonomuraea coxensis DSM 45129 TaxID=1122611 RepID=A0ABX8TRD5_9ACTN|nr:c-type cytochrome biogenesis protein CcsB [Nonomuraea coxensis]QYC38046.1 Cytochrome c biogenesis protein CcsA [Nonomuraea coxensis DSM 45129]